MGLSSDDAKLISKEPFFFVERNDSFLPFLIVSERILGGRLVDLVDGVLSILPNFSWYGFSELVVRG